MSDEAERVLDAALKLPDAERAELVAILADSIGDGSSPQDVLASWIAEAKRRSELIRRGEMELVDAEEVRARLRARIRQATDESRASTG